MARNTFRSQNVQNTPMLGPLLEVEMSKKSRRCGAKHISKSKCTKHTMLGQLFGSCDEKVQLWRKAHFEVKMYKRLHVRATFGG